jgi:hypothetical protein
VGTQDTGERQSRDTSNIGHTGHRRKTIKKHFQHWVHRTQEKDNQETLPTLDTHDTGERQSRDTSNIGHRRKKINLQSRARTHAVLVIGLHELLGNPTT